MIWKGISKRASDPSGIKGEKGFGTGSAPLTPNHYAELPIMWFYGKAKESKLSTCCSRIQSS